MQFSVRVWNRGRDARFTARVNSDVEGCSVPKYGNFMLPRDGTVGEEAYVEQDSSRDVHVARIYLEQAGEIQFMVPPAYGMPWKLGVGIPNAMKKDTRLVFEFAPLGGCQKFTPIPRPAQKVAAVDQRKWPRDNDAIA